MANGYIDNSTYVSGEWNLICDVCGFRFKSGKIKKRWDGLLVCKDDWETDHPQKYIRVREDGQSVPYIRDEPTDQFVYVCYLWGAGAYADLAEADCARADNTVFSYEYLLSLIGEALGVDFDTLFLDDDQLFLDEDELGF
jgi:hypothetical protein